MSTLVTIMVGGLAIGAIYALLAFAYCLVFKASHTINFALGALLLVAGYLTYELGPGVRGLPFSAAWGLALLAVLVIGWALFRLIGQPLRRASPDAVIVATIGADLALRSVVLSNQGWSLTNVDVGAPWTTSTSILGTNVATSSLWIILICAVVLAALGACVRWTTLGLWMRACADDLEAAQAQGISTRRNLALTWVIAAGLAAVAGVLVGAYPNTLDMSSYSWALRALPAAVLGGMDSLRGAVIGGALVGLVETTTAAYQPAWLGGGFQLITPYLLMFVLLLYRPQGLFGSRRIVRV